MAVITSFFDAYNNDIQYDAQDMMRAFEGIVSEGIFQHVGKGFMCYVGALEVTVDTGKAYLNGRFLHNISGTTLQFSKADPTNPRYDAIVIWVSNQTRSGGMSVRTGTPSATPAKYVRPTPNSDYAEFTIWHVKRAAGETALNVNNFEWSMGTSDAPWVQPLI